MDGIGSSFSPGPVERPAPAGPAESAAAAPATEPAAASDRASLSSEAGEGDGRSAASPLLDGMRDNYANEPGAGNDLEAARRKKSDPPAEPGDPKAEPGEPKAKQPKKKASTARPRRRRVTPGKVGRALEIGGNIAYWAKRAYDWVRGNPPADDQQGEEN